MKPHRIVPVLLAGLLFAGCRSSGRDINQQLLERELRLQEDHIYALEDELDDFESQLESARYENEALKKQLATGDRGALDSPSAPMIDLPEAPAASPRRSEPRRSEPRSMPMPSGRGSSPAPLIEPGIQIDPGEEFDPSTPAAGAAHSKRITDRNVQRIVLNKQLTGGVNHNGRGGDQGVLVVFEPRNKAGQMLDVPGEISIAVLDSAKQGPEARIARWDFTPAEAQKFFGKSALGRGYHIELPWPGDPPTNRKLQLFVRFVTADGRKLLADMPLDVSPPTDREAKRWRGVPAGTRRFPAASRSTAPPYQSTAEPTAKFLDPPAIVPESEAIRLPGVQDDRADADDGPDLDSADERAARKQRKNATSSRPVWTPYR
jgi:hypothetical protein